MRKIIVSAFISVLAAVSCSTKTFTPNDLIGEWIVYEEPNIKYTFENDTLMYIDDLCSEGEPYTYEVIKDTLFYRSLDDNSLQWLVLDSDNSTNTLFVHNDNEHFVLSRKTSP